MPMLKVRSAQTIARLKSGMGFVAWDIGDISSGVFSVCPWDVAGLVKFKWALFLLLREWEGEEKKSYVRRLLLESGIYESFW